MSTGSRIETAECVAVSGSAISLVVGPVVFSGLQKTFHCAITSIFFTFGLCDTVALSTGSITGTDLAVDGGYSAMGPEMAEPAIPKLTQ
jgi:hypothetical protein